MNEEKFRLDVFWNLDVDTLLDDNQRACDAAGIKESSAGSNFETRDMQFWYDTNEERTAAMERLKDAGFRFFP